MSLSQRGMVVVLAVLLLVAAGFLVSTTQGTSTHLGQTREGRQDGVSTGGVPVSVALLSSLATAGVAALAILATDRREAVRLGHERQLKLEELEAQRQTRLRDERRQAYTEFFTRWHTYEDLRIRKRQDEEFVSANLAYQRSYNALSLVAPPEVRVAANAMRWEEEPGVRQDPSGAPARFMQAARKDLSIPD